MSTTPETPTPETDLEEANQTQRFGGYMVKASFARRLERERDAARAENEAMREAIKTAYDALEEARERTHPDKQACDSMFHVYHKSTRALAKLKPFLPDATPPKP